MRRAILILVVVSVVAVAAIAAVLARQPGAEARVRRVLQSREFQQASAYLDAHHDRVTDDTIRLTEIPAPPFKEAARATAFRDMLREAGLPQADIDPQGNVVALRKGSVGGTAVALAAHLDTVFPEGTDVRVKRSGTRLTAPGVGDNSRSLAVLLALARAMTDLHIQTASDILFVGDVGEEGPGDLRGVRYLFQQSAYRTSIKTFIAVDGAGAGGDITTRGVGSRRYHVVFKGPGGHSYADFGIVNPAFAMANAIDKLARMTVPDSPKTTFNVGTIGGGTSVNSIPFETFFDLDLRSESAQELASLDASAAQLSRQAVDEENHARSTTQGAVRLEMQPTGERPAGQTPSSSSLVQTVVAVVAASGLTPRLSASSTDANIPMSLGVPAVTLDSGGTGDRAHALDEWIDVDKATSLTGIRNVLAVLLAVAGGA